MINKQLFPGAEFESAKSAFHGAYPFKHIVFDGIFSEIKLREAATVFPQVSSGWTNYLHHTERKFGLNDPALFPGPILEIVNALHSDEFLEIMGRLTEIPGLVCDPLLSGGGLHVMKTKGYLKVHTDFNTHPIDRSLKRALNLILFLNDDWKEEYGGDLQFWTASPAHCSKTIFPAFNRAALFETNRYSFHGVPEPLKCPATGSRNTLALYYYQKARPVGLFSVKGTFYLKHSGMTWREKTMTDFENLLLQLYTLMRLLFRSKVFDKVSGRFLSGLRIKQMTTN